MKKLLRYFKLRNEIKKSNKKISEIQSELDFFYSFEVIETYSWFDCVNELKCMLSEEKKKLSGFEKEKELVFVRN
jgi:hypothetical protein